jgi:uncharacterized protein
MKTHAFRLTRGQDLKKEIKKFASENNIKAGAIVTSVGCVTKATVRMAGAKTTNNYSEPLEIVSLVGTLSTEDCHLHASFSKEDGTVIGGHLKDGCIVDTTAEIIIAEFNEFQFTTEPDQTTGYDELKITKV